jgi:hypothetical protein
MTAMNDDIVPVLLEFIDLAPDSNISIKITTPGITWSLGSRFGDTLGLSYNVVPDGLAAAESAIREWVINENMLLIRTSAEATSLSSFTLSLFMRRQDLTDSLMGYCTLNEEAVIRAQLGNQRPITWRNGRISALLGPGSGSFRQVLFAVRNLRPGNVVNIDLATPSDMGEVAWTLGPAFVETQGVRVASTAGLIPLSSFCYSSRYIRLVTHQSGGGEATDVALLAYVSWELEALQLIYLKAECSDGIEIHAQLGNRQPQFLSGTYTLFTL